MKSHSKDFVFFSVFLSLFALSLVALWADFYFVKDQAKSSAIGNIYFKEKTAERKLAAQPLWNSIKTGGVLYNFDSVRTEAGASAIIHLDGGTQIEIGEKTLIVLNVSDKVGIQLKGGNVSAKQSGTQKVSLNAGNIEALISGGKINFVQSEDGSFSLDSDVALDLLSIDGRDIEVGKDQIVQITKDGKVEVKQSAYLLESPSPSSVFLTANQNKTIPFSWKNSPSNSEKKTASKRILVSTKADFSKIHYTFLAKENNYRGSLAPALYYWRVVGENGESGIGKFQVFQDKPAVPLFPPNDGTVDYVSSLPLVSFRWRESEHALAYRVRVFKDETMTQEVHNFLSYTNSISSDLLEKGIYYWNVLSVYPNAVNADAVVSKSFRFHINQIDNIKAPELLQKKENMVVSQNTLDSETPVLQWKDDPNVDYYTVEIAKDKDFENIEVRKKTKYNFFAPPDTLKDGKHFWRVKAHAGKKHENTSDTKTFEIKRKGEIINQSPAQNSSFFKGEDIYFSWNDTDKTNRYILEFSNTEDFAKIVSSFDVSKSSLSLNNLEEAEYYWRVSSLTKEKKRLIVSSSSRLSVKDRLPPLVLLTPKEKATVDLSYKDKLVCSWQRIKEANAYRIKLYSKIADIDSLVYDKIVFGGVFETSDLPAFNLIDYSWEVFALRKRNGNYNQISETAVGHFTVILSEELVIPKIRDPGTTFIYEK